MIYLGGNGNRAIEMRGAKASDESGRRPVALRRLVVVVD
jgi:hypothetical protein